MKQGAVKQFTRISLFLLSVSYITDNMGSMPHNLSDLIGLCLLITFVLTYLPIKPKSKDIGNSSSSNTLSAWKYIRTLKSWPNISLVLLIIASLALVLIQEGVAELLGPSLLLFGLDLILRKVHVPHKELPTLLLTLMFYGFFLTFCQYAPQFWYLLQKFALLFSQTLGHIINKDVTLGITYSGLSIVVLFTVYYISAFVLSEIRRPFTLAGVLFALVLAYAIYVIAWSFLVASTFSQHLDVADPLVSRFDFKILLFILLLFPTFYYIRSVRPRNIAVTGNKRDTKRMAWAMVMFILSIVILTVQVPGSITSKDVVFYDNGYLDWSLPTFGQYSFKRIGMFGVLPPYLEARGYTTRIENTVTPQSLSNASTLVVINLNQSFDEEAKQTIWEFVENGGSLLVIGEHTGHELIRKPFNDLLQPVNIAYNFDSAIPLEDRWVHAYELKPHPLLHGISGDEMQISIGASLAVSGSSKPVVLGKYGFSDAGNLFNSQEGYLGDMTFSQDEQLGDLVLVAEAYYGDGKVLVFGDTNSFQNGLLASSYRFVDNVFSWLATSRGNNFYPYNILLSLALLAASLALLFFRMRVNTTSFMVCTVVLALVLSVSPVVSAVKVKDYGKLEADVANIDVSHVERCSLGPYSSDGIDGLEANLMRNGYMPLLMKDFSTERLDNSRLLAIVAPVDPFSRDEIAVIKQFVANGGLLLLTVGWEESEASSSLLGEFGMGVDNIPLGRITSTQNSEGVSLWEAWPLIYEEGDNTEVLVEVWGYAVIVFHQYGEGGILVAGDSSFLLNKNLEEVYSYNEGNILFLKECLHRFNMGWFQNE